MKIPRLSLNLTIRSRLLLLTGFILAILIGSNVYMRGHIVAGTDVLHNQSRLQNMTATATRLTFNDRPMTVQSCGDREKSIAGGWAIAGRASSKRNYS